MSDGQDAVFDRIAELTELYLLDALDADQHAELETLLREDPQALAAMQTCLRQAGMMRVVFSEQQQFASRIGEVDRDAYLKLLQTLKPDHEPEPVRLVGQLSTARPIWQQWPVVFTSAVAALLAIAVTLIIVLSGSSNAPNTRPPVADTPTDRHEPGRVGTAVATLTATHNAVWASPQAEGASAPVSGSPLHPNQTLTLTAGFAEITTNDGAVAILESPATVELLDHNNAIRLHTGKLVGICETESSKGFTVRTPHLDITDLGTRFGVDASTTDATEVHVFEGEVQAAQPPREGDDADDAIVQRLTQGDAIRATSAGQGFAAVDHDTDRFAALLPTTTPLPGTGFGLAVGDTDPNWQIVAIDGRKLDTPRPLTVGGQGHTRTHRNDPASSQWFSWLPSAAEQNQAECIYLVRTTLDLPQAIATPGAHLALQYMADNELRAVHINGTRIALPEVDVTDMFTKFHRATIDRHLKPGPNTIEFELVNLMLNGGKSGEAGFRVAWELVTPTTPPPGDTR